MKMVEQQQYKAKKGFQSADAKYMGLADEPKTGTGAKGDWRVVKTNWMIDGREKANKFTIWTPMKSAKTKYKSEEELQQFQRYRIVWAEEDKKHNGNEWVDKKIVIIQDVGDDNKAPATQQQSSMPEKNKIEHKGDTAIIAQDVITTVEKLDNWSEFESSYKELVNKDLQSVNHMIGTYLKTYYPGLFSVLYGKCKETLSEEVK